MNDRGSTPCAANNDALRRDWLESRLGKLLDLVEGWARELEWSTRRVPKRLEDRELGCYEAPALVLQQETVRALVEPIARSAPGADGVVDLYLLPGYDDIASLYLVGGQWQLQYRQASNSDLAIEREGAAQPLTKESFAEVLNLMKANAV
jgi:hypothetical protein